MMSLDTIFQFYSFILYLVVFLLTSLTSTGLDLFPPLITEFPVYIWVNYVWKLVTTQRFTVFNYLLGFLSGCCELFFKTVVFQSLWKTHCCYHNCHCTVLYYSTINKNSPLKAERSLNNDAYFPPAWSVIKEVCWLALDRTAEPLLTHTHHDNPLTGLTHHRGQRCLCWGYYHRLS